MEMQSEIRTRLEKLKEEYKKGQERLNALEQETTNLTNTMLRISGAIQILEELTEKVASANSNGLNTEMQKTKESEK
jgi:predicted nuclease with TOPRIM domain